MLDYNVTTKDHRI